MRRFLITSICFAIICAGFGCGEKKSDNKGSLRGRGGAAGGSAKPLSPQSKSSSQDGAKDKDSANDDAYTPDEIKERVTAAKTATPKECDVEPLLALNGEGTEPIDGFGELVGNGESGEYVLTEFVHFYERRDGSEFTPQYLVKATGFVDETSPTAKSEANKNTEVLCENSVDKLKAPIDLKGFAQLINRFSLDQDGSYLSLRKVEVKAAGSVVKVDNEFTPVASSVKNDEASDSKNKMAARLADQGTVTKDTHGNVYWKASKTETINGVEEINTVAAKYEKRSSKKIEPSVTSASATP